MDNDARVRFQDAVEAARLGAIFAHPSGQQSYRRWRSRTESQANRRKRPMTDQQIEAAIMRVASMFPDNIERVH